MKIKSLLVALLISAVSYAQDFQGTITYKITYDDLPAEMQAYESMMPNETKLFVRDNLSKSVTNNPMAGGESIILTNNETGEMMQLQDVMGEKYAITFSAEAEDGEVSYEDSGEEKEIAGYKCNIASAEKDGLVLTVCYTKELPAIKNKNVQGLDGFPLEIVMEMEQMTMIQTVAEVKEGKVDKIKFEAPAGYTEMTLEEFQAKMTGGK